MSSTSNARRRGRPRKPPGLKKRRVSVTLSGATLELVDSARAGTSRSAYIEQAIGRSEDQEREAIKRNGVVYTPDFLARFVAAKAVSVLLDGKPSRKGGHVAPRQLRFIDPACGDGVLLCSLWEELVAALTQKGRRAANAAGTLLPTQQLCGIDIDAKAISRTRQRIARLSKTPAAADGYRLLSTNALFPFKQPTHRGWNTVRQRFDAAEGFDVVIANPPWGADTTAYQESLMNGDFVLRKGQFDTSDLFLELALKIVRPGGVIAFIIPDSLFNRERTELRRLLLDTTQVKLVARLGEKIFGNVSRACAVVVCRKSESREQSMVECLRLTPDVRRHVLLNEVSLFDAQAQLGHLVPQRRFMDNAEFRFDIDTTADEQGVIDKLTEGRRTLRDYLVSSRGMELSKSGRVCRCGDCGLWMPLPTSRSPKCIHCRRHLAQQFEQHSIVSTEPADTLQPLLVGETVTRYLSAPRHWVDTRIEGVNFKDAELYRSPKIVVRKTGVGISAALDLSGAITNQVVYILRRRHASPAIPLEVFLGVLNSRAMYYYLVKTHGETEWRSHPYLTQTQVLDFPMPKVDWTEQGIKRRSARIRRLIGQSARRGSKVSAAADAEIEGHIAALFGLTRREYRVIYETLDSVEQLLPVRELKRVELAGIFPR